jgi:hypothetical protein
MAGSWRDELFGENDGRVQGLGTRHAGPAGWFLHVGRWVFCSSGRVWSDRVLLLHSTQALQLLLLHLLATVSLASLQFEVDILEQLLLSNHSYTRHELSPSSITPRLQLPTTVCTSVAYAANPSRRRAPLRA